MLRVKDSQLNQRVRAISLKEGDGNSNFFHASIICRSIRNVILPIKKVKD